MELNLGWINLFQYLECNSHSNGTLRALIVSLQRCLSNLSCLHVAMIQRNEQFALTLPWVYHPKKEGVAHRHLNADDGVDG